MKMLNRKPLILLIGAIVVAATAAVFFTRDYYSLPHYITGFVFVIIAEIGFFLGLLHTTSSTDRKDDKVFSASGVTAITVIYLVIAVILGLFAGSFSEKLTDFILLEVIALAACVIILLVILAISRRSADKDRQTLECETNKSNEPKRGGF